MSAKAVDVLIFIPLIFALPPLGFLPWGRWIPTKIAGPYLLYCAFAIWHFKQSWGAILVFGSMGIALSVVAILDLRKTSRVKQARERKASILQHAKNWPVVEGFVFYVGQNHGADGVRQVTLSYAYKVQDEAFVGSESFPFTNRDDAERFKSRCRGRKLSVHYQRDKPEICILERDRIQGLA